MNKRQIHDPRVCTRSGDLHPLSDFYRNPKTGYYSSWCKDCLKVYHRDRYQRKGLAHGEKNGNCRFRGDLRQMIRDSSLGDTALARLLESMLHRRIHRSTLHRIKNEARPYEPLKVRTGPILWLANQLLKDKVP